MVLFDTASCNSSIKQVLPRGPSHYVVFISRVSTDTASGFVVFIDTARVSKCLVSDLKLTRAVRPSNCIWTSVKSLLHTLKCSRQRVFVIGDLVRDIVCVLNDKCQFWFLSRWSPPLLPPPSPIREFWNRDFVVILLNWHSTLNSGLFLIRNVRQQNI